MSLSVKLLVLGLVACGGGAASPANKQETGFIGLLNQQRARAGCAAAATNDALVAAAQRHVTDMHQNGVRDHTGSDGSMPADRIAQAGFAGTATGEILYWNTAGGPQEAVTSWMNSPEHRAVVADCQFTAIGGAEARNGGYFAVVTFGG